MKKMHIVENYNLYSSTDMIMVVKQRRMRWAGRVAGMGEKNT
jgi:hypothetical protein